MEAWQWLILASMLAVGVLIGWAVGRSKTDSFKKVQELEQKVRDAETEQEAYRKQVADHFGTTAQLFNQLTTDYRAVYEHLASSSQTLCGDQVPKLASMAPQQDRMLDAEAEQEMPAPEAVADAAVSSEAGEGAQATEAAGSEVHDEQKGEPEVEAVAKKGNGEDESEETAAQAAAAESVEKQAGEARTIH